MRKLQKLIHDYVSGGKSLRQIAAESQVEYTSISNYYHRNVEPRGKNLGLLAAYFNVPFADLLDDYVPASAVSAPVPVAIPTRTVPVISKAQAGTEGFWEDAYPVGEGMDRVSCPDDIIDPAAFAFRVEGDSMAPRYLPGEVVIVDTTKPVMNNDDVVCKLVDGSVMVKRYKIIHGVIFLESYNSAVEPIPVTDGDMVRCYKVVCRR